MKRRAENKIMQNIRVIMSIMLLFAMLFSVFFLVAEAGHHCDDDDCAICACMQICEKQLRDVGGSLPVSFLVVFSLSVLCAKVLYSAVYPKAFLFSYKVRLNI
ncbi:MAG: hypothetical protein K6B44_02180 [Lachnospiraceae bacterium]|nr:hypothetical protein [Lachnospiraceae bacterium]